MTKIIRGIGKSAGKAGQAIAENKAGDTIKLISFDADNMLVGFLRDGTISALVVQDPFRMGSAIIRVPQLFDLQRAIP